MGMISVADNLFPTKVQVFQFWAVQLLHVYNGRWVCEMNIKTSWCGRAAYRQECITSTSKPTLKYYSWAQHKKKASRCLSSNLTCFSLLLKKFSKYPTVCGTFGKKFLTGVEQAPSQYDHCGGSIPCLDVLCLGELDQLAKWEGDEDGENANALGL